ncbi:MAG TPA: HNH endonuclease [Deltaproteobacteria bacterium]|nr:MAG: HNH endonuclease [Deltaproteobacteria bacterium]HEC31051.1 HNH endonuclease [Deltaproteobacteria bacterium]
MKDYFIVTVTDAEIRKEKEKARKLRNSQWWHRKRARGICHYCRRKFHPRELTMDHIVPLIRGGKSTKGNIVAVCKECNTKKKYLLPWEWEEYIRDFINKTEL